MASQILTQAAKLINDDIVRGVVEDVIDLSPIFGVLPFDSFTGQTVNANFEAGDFETSYVGKTDVNDSLAGLKAAMTYNTLTYYPTKIIGDVEMDGLVQATSESAGVDQTALEIAMKTKGVGRAFLKGMVMDANGTNPGTSTDMYSLHFITTDANFGNGLTNIPTAGAAAETNITFELLDEMMELCTSKYGQVDFLMSAPATYRQYKKLLRGGAGGITGALGGVASEFVMNIPFVDGRQRTVLTYEGTPWFRNDFIDSLETASGAALSGGTFTSMYAGNFDDGSRRVGCAGIYPAAAPAGVVVQPVGAMEGKDESIWRVKWYTNFVAYNRRGLARLSSIDPTDP